MSRNVRCGVGVTFEEHDDRSLVVCYIAPESPAEKSGRIALGDVLHEVDGKPVFRAHIDYITKIVPGPQGSYVELGFKRAGRINRFPALECCRRY